MSAPRWPLERPPDDEMGVVVHGPVLLARSPGIAAGLRCVFAYPSGLQLPLALRAEGVQAEAANRGSYSPGLGERSGQPWRGEPWPGPALLAGTDGEQRRVVPGAATSGGGRMLGGTDDGYRFDGFYWIGHLPTDSTLRLTIAWPEAGLAETTTVLKLANLDELTTRVVHLS
jgi:hypothetical protein